MAQGRGRENTGSIDASSICGRRACGECTGSRSGTSLKLILLAVVGQGSHVAPLCFRKVPQCGTGWKGDPGPMQCSASGKRHIRPELSDLGEVAIPWKDCVKR